MFFRRVDFFLLVIDPRRCCTNKLHLCSPGWKEEECIKILAFRLKLKCICDCVTWKFEGFMSPERMRKKILLSKRHRDKQEFANTFVLLVSFTIAIFIYLFIYFFWFIEKSIFIVAFSLRLLTPVTYANISSLSKT